MLSTGATSRWGGREAWDGADSTEAKVHNSRAERSVLVLFWFMDVWLELGRDPWTGHTHTILSHTLSTRAKWDLPTDGGANIAYTDRSKNQTSVHQFVSHQPSSTDVFSAWTGGNFNCGLGGNESVGNEGKWGTNWRGWPLFMSAQLLFPTCSSLVYSWKHSSRVQLCCCRCCCCWLLTLSASFTTSSWMLPNRLQTNTNNYIGRIDSFLHCGEKWQNNRCSGWK